MPDSERLPGEQASTIASAVVRCLSEYTGRGPTKARAYLHRDVITVVLQDTLTKGERSLVANGQADLVLQTRKQYQNAMGTDLVSAVEEITGRRVMAFMSDNHIEPDVAAEIFVMEPEREQ
jgi:uncharacterized protein YbcI